IAARITPSRLAAAPRVKRWAAQRKPRLEKDCAMRQVILIPDTESGGTNAEVPSSPGCYSQGETREQAIANIREAIALHIESMIAHGEEVPEDVAPIQLIAV